MTLTEEYYSWLLDIIRMDECEPQASDLIYALFSTEFVCKLERDLNRIGDGLRLRSDYAASCGLTEASYDELDISVGPCTVLEMMIGLALRADDEIMYNEEEGDRAYKWFWLMIKSLGMDELCYIWSEDGSDYTLYKDMVERFLYRRYRPDGKGGLFTIRNCDEDLTKVEIWYQMSWFFSKNYDIL